MMIFHSYVKLPEGSLKKKKKLHGSGSHRIIKHHEIDGEIQGEIPKNLKKNLIKPTIVVNIWFILIVNIQRIYG